MGASKRATDNDLRFFESYLKHMNSVPDVSWDAVAADMGLAHGGSARERFRQIKQKLGWAGPSATPRGNKRKSAAAAAAAEGGEDGESLEPETPTKRPKTKAAAGGAGRKKKNQSPAGDAVKDEDANAANNNDNEQRDESIDNVMAGEA